MCLVRGFTLLIIMLLITMTLPAAQATEKAIEALVSTRTPPAKQKDFIFDYYSENLFYTHRSTTDSRVRGLYEFVDNVFGYAGVRATGESRPAGTIPYMDDSVSPLLGVQWRPFYGAVVWAEYLQRFTAKDDKSIADPRFGAAYYHLITWLNSHRFGPFVEFYGESVFITRISSTPISSGWARTGLWWQFSGDWHFDPYFEIYGQTASEIELGRDQLLFRPGIRLQYLTGRLTAGLLYYANVKMGGNPLPDDSQVMFVLGGAL